MECQPKLYEKYINTDINLLFSEKKLEYNTIKHIYIYRKIYICMVNAIYIYILLECSKCKIQYVGKAETEFNIRLDNHRKDVWKPDAIPASCHFSGKSHNFNTHAKFILD